MNLYEASRCRTKAIRFTGQGERIVFVVRDSREEKGICPICGEEFSGRLIGDGEIDLLVHGQADINYPYSTSIFGCCETPVEGA